MHRNTLITLALLSLLGIFTAHIVVTPVIALPAGSTILSNSTAGTPTSTPGEQNDSRGTISTLVMDSLQQDQYWKAYVGNITGRLSLDDASSFTIYDWPVSVSKIGEVYITRHASPDFTNVSCANIGNISSEEAWFGMGSSQTDNIRNTFNQTVHQPFIVHTTTLSNSTCNSTATYRNDSVQNLTGNNHYFQEIVIQDSSDQIIFVS